MAESRIELAPEWSEDPWFRFPRAFIRDATLSWKAKGVAALLASHSSNFRFSADEISKWATDGRRAVQGALRELEDAGYLRRERAVNGHGRATGMIYQLFPSPQVEPQGGFGPAENAPTANGPAENRTDPYKESTPKEYITPKEDHQEDPAERGVATAAEDLPFEPAKDGGLFDDAPLRPEPEPPAPRAFSAGTVVAAYVDSFRERSGGKDPVKRYIAQVGREAKAMIDSGVASDVLLAAAKALGRTAYASLERQVMMAQSGSDGRDLGNRYDGAYWAGQETEERDADGLTAEDRLMIERHGVTISYGNRK